MKDFLGKIWSRIKNDLISDWTNFYNWWQKRKTITKIKRKTRLLWDNTKNSISSVNNSPGNTITKYWRVFKSNKLMGIMAIFIILLIPMMLFGITKTIEQTKLNEQSSISAQSAENYTNSIIAFDTYKAEVAKQKAEEEARKKAEEEARKKAEAAALKQLDGEDVSCGYDKNIVYMGYDIYIGNGGSTSSTGSSSTGIAMYNDQYMVAMGNQYPIGESYRVTLSNGQKFDIYNAGRMASSDGCTTDTQDAIIELLVYDDFAYAWAGTAYALGLSVDKITTIPEGN